MLTGLEDGATVPAVKHKEPIKPPPPGIPLSNQILYEKLDFDMDGKEAAAETTQTRDR